MFHSIKRAINRCALAVTLSTAVIAAAPVYSQCQYEVSAIIQAPPCQFGDRPPLVGSGMNELGHVVGSYHDCSQSAHDHGFFYTSDTGLVTMHKPEDVWRVNPTDINDAGLIVGSLQVSGVGKRGFVYDMHTEDYVAYLQPLHGEGDTALNAINNAGIAVGSRAIGKRGTYPMPFNAVIWDTASGGVTDLGVGDGPNSVAVDISEAGDAAGWSGTAYFTVDARGLLWIADEVQQLEPLPGMVQNAVRAINNQFDAVGTSGDGTFGTLLQFLWLDGTMSQFFPPAGYDLAGPADINDSRQIVGSMRVEGTSTYHPYLWQHGTFHDLRDLIVGIPPNLTITGAGEIGNDGRVRAGGTGIGNVAVVLTPVGQPTGDLNYDCRVDVHDLLVVLDAWGPLPRATQQTSSPSDLNGDGVVNVSDLLILLANWGD